MFEMKEIKGLESLSVLNVYQSLLIGLQLMPAYRAMDSDDFFSLIEEMPKEDQEKVFWDAAKTVPLEREELEKLLRYFKDPNGVSLSRENINALSPMEIAQMVVQVCMKMVEIKIDFVTESEKKKSLISQ